MTQEILELNPDGLREFRLTTGEVLTFYPLNADMVGAIRDAYPDPDPPIRQVETVVPGVTDPEPDYDDPGYREQVQEVARRRGQAMIRLLVVQGLPHIDPPEGWEDQQRFVLPGWEMPDDPLERKCYWVEHWLIRSPVDLAALTNIASLAAALKPEEVEQALKSFRDQMEDAISNEAGAAIRAAVDELRVGDYLGQRVGGDTADGDGAAADEVAGEDRGGEAGPEHH